MTPSERVYTIAIRFAYDHDVDWALSRRLGEVKFLDEYPVKINLGVMTGKTTAAANFASTQVDTIVVTRTAAQAENLRKRFNLRAESLESYNRSSHSCDPLIIFDSCNTPGSKLTAEAAILNLRPKRFIRLGDC